MRGGSIVNWTTYTPNFAYEQEHPHIVIASAWGGHRRFAYDLVRNVQPRTIVELGTHWGLSFFSFCQAVVDGGLNSECYAIDTWLGDQHSGQYGGEVLDNVQHVAIKHYTPAAVLVQSTFDDAIVRFQDASIDLLHIDGCHTFEAVRHDYETWLPKLANNGIILFHDTEVRLDNFGVYKFWQQMRHLPHLEFTHSSGLGILFPKGVPESMNDLLADKESFVSIYKPD
jgi:predicted O-methyltransferase YrrM